MAVAAYAVTITGTTASKSLSVAWHHASVELAGSSLQQQQSAKRNSDGATCTDRPIVLVCRSLDGKYLVAAKPYRSRTNQ